MSKANNPKRRREWAARLLLMVLPLVLIELIARLLPIDATIERTAIKRLRFGVGMEAGGLVAGWDVIEPELVWANRLSASFVFQDFGSEDLRVTAEILPMSSPDGEPQTLSVTLNDIDIASLTLSPRGFQRYSMFLPAAALRRGDNLLRFKFRYTAWTGVEGLGHRALAAAFRELDFSRPILPLPSHLTANETYRTLARWQMLRTSPDAFEVDSNLFWRLRPRSQPHFGGPINQRGWRGPELQDRQPGRLRVVCVGDSRTFGTYIGWRQIWPTLLAQELERQLGRPVEVINAGTPGYSSHQGWVLLQQIVPALQPDAVTLYFGMNDAAFTRGQPDHLQTVGYPALRQISRALEVSRAYRLLQHWLRPDDQADPRPRARPRVAPERFKLNLERSIDLCKDRHIAVVLLFSSVDPTATHVLGSLQPLLKTQQRVIHELATEYAVGLLDLDQVVSQGRVRGFFRTERNDPGHPSSVGHALISQWLAPILAQQLRARVEPRSAARSDALADTHP